MYDVRKGVQICNVLHVEIQLSQLHLLKKTILSPIELSWHPFQISVDLKCKSLFPSSQFH